MTISAGLGIANFPFSDHHGFWRWVDLCDAGGVDSLWQSDRLVSSEPHLEAKFGMNVLSLGLRDPVVTAKACATIDVLSGGRLLPAFGLGSARSRDYVATGTPTRGRGKRADEGLEILARLWSETRVSFAGEHYRLDEATISPRPIQQPLPLWVGGAAAQAVERTARWGTGWQAGIESPEEVAPVVAAIRARSAELGRPIDEDHYGAGFAFRFDRPDAPIVEHYRNALRERLGREPEGFMAAGDTADILELLHRFRAAGIHKFILRPIAADTDDFIAQTRLFVERLQPEIKALNR